MPAKKKDPATELAEKMLQVLEAQRRLGGDSYPPRLRRLAELADPAAPEDLVRKAAAKKKPFGARAVAVQPKDLDSPVALVEDTDQLAASPLLLDYLLHLVCTPESPTCDPGKLKGKLPTRLKQPFEAALRRRLDENDLPPSVALVPVKKKQHLHLRRYPLPRAPEVALAEDLVGALRTRRGQGDSGYPLTLDQLLQSVRSQAADDLVKKAVAVPVFKEAVVLALKPTAAQLRGTPVALAEDRDRLAGSPLVLLAALRTARQGDAQIFQPADLAKQVVPALKKPLAAAILRLAEGRSLPAGVGCLFQKKGKPWLFLLSDVPGSRPEGERAPARTEPAAVSPASALGDFAQRFDEAFRASDRQGGGHNQVSLVDLRRAMPVDRQTFDAGLQELRRLGRYTLSGAEGRHGISPAEQDAGIPEHGTLLLHVSRKLS